MAIVVTSGISAAVAATAGVLILVALSALLIFFCLDNQPRNMAVERQPSRDKDGKVMSDEREDTLLFIDDNVVNEAGRESDARMPSRFQGESYVEGSTESVGNVGSYMEVNNKIQVRKGQFPKLPLRVTKKKKLVPQSFAEY